MHEHLCLKTASAASDNTPLPQTLPRTFPHGGSHGLAPPHAPPPPAPPPQPAARERRRRCRRERAGRRADGRSRCGAGEEEDPDEGWIGGKAKKDGAGGRSKNEPLGGRFADLISAASESHYQLSPFPVRAT